jgi:type VI secretion system secreted protein Hcp
VTSFQFGISLPVHITKAGVDKSTANLSDIMLTKAFDSMSPALFSASSLGLTIDEVLIEFVGTAGDGTAGSVVYLTYKLKNAIVSSLTTSSGGDKPHESLSLAYEDIEMTFNTPPKTAKNKAGQPVVQKFSIIANKKV